jgi:serine phosphatase RsbU (regulator of sigma subunit)
VLTVQSFQKNAYQKQHLTLLKNLASYIGIAIDNARNYALLESVKRTIETKNRYTTDSIRYAKTIQDAILPDKTVLENAFGEGNYFIIYEAKDIVSGDFYWCRSFESRTYFAIIDCTGHGVPGALMSMIGNTLLTDIIAQNAHLSPAQILEQLHQSVRHTLKQKDNYNDDGMDIALLMIERSSKSQRVVFAGAHQSLYHVSGQNLTILQGCRHSVGGKQTHKTHHFIDETIENLKVGDMIYLTTDGFTDQNDENRIKYGSKKLRENFLKIAPLPLLEQSFFIRNELEKQLINTELRDDITIAGIRI